MGFNPRWLVTWHLYNPDELIKHQEEKRKLYGHGSRYGSNQDYKRLANSLHKRGMKLIMDYVINHWGTQHWMVKDPPTKDWIHYFEKSSLQRLVANLSVKSLAVF